MLVNHVSTWKMLQKKWTTTGQRFVKRFNTSDVLRQTVWSLDQCPSNPDSVRFDAVVCWDHLRSMNIKKMHNSLSTTVRSQNGFRECDIILRKYTSGGSAQRVKIEMKSHKWNNVEKTLHMWGHVCAMTRVVFTKKHRTSTIALEHLRNLSRTSAK